MTISFTTNNNLELVDATTVDIFAAINANFQLLDVVAGRASALAGVALAAFVPVYVDATGKFQLADNTRTPSSATPTVGITETSFANGASARAVFLGLVTNPAWAWAAGGKVYVGAVAGTLTQVANAAPIGIAMSATTVLLLPSRA